ncbi:MAG: hypothetical protein KBD12_02745 [Candidatus Pacebacteria bacterium]|nr:hypothetical protein [Candidatus Paceibacterota bacterium]
MIKKVAAIIIVVLLTLSILYYFYQPYDQRKLVGQQKQSVICTSSCYIFLEDFEVKQSVYSGGDFPSGTKTTQYKKGQIVEGKSSSTGCQGEGCVPEKIIIIHVNDQNWSVSPTILVPYKQ